MTRRLQLFLNALGLAKVQQRAFELPVRTCSLCTQPIVKLDKYRQSGERFAHDVCYRAAVRP